MLRSDPGLAHLENLAWLVVGISAAPSVWAWTEVGSRVGVRRALAIASVVQAVGISLGVLVPGTAGVLASAAALGVTFMGITALGFAVAQPLAAEPRRRMTALMTAAFGVGQIIGPVFGGVMADRTGSFLAPTLLSAGALLMAAACVLLPGRSSMRR
jgi:predicted MFS family arabinose efflux permease